MLEWLATIGVAELGKALFEQGLKLGQAAAEDYVKDFFKGCLKEGMIAAKPEVAKKAVAEALQAFLLLMVDELEDRELSRAEIRDRYDPALVQFVQEQSVKPILGKAFAKDCRSIDGAELAAIWQRSTVKGNPFPTMPKGFDWQRIGNEYLKKVRRIVRETSELRSLLETELLEDIARNTAQLSPGFDVAKYRDSLQSSYGDLKLSTIDTTDQHYRIKLWNMFIEQTVREALPPMRHELPLDLKRELQAQGQLEADLSPEALEHYRREYFQQPSQKVLSAIFQTSDFSEKSEVSACHAVVLGDPGAGKSTLLQYLAIAWAEGKSKALPLLIELREYAIVPVNNFLDFLHRGRGVDWQFDQRQLHQHLLDYPTLVMFDGLDEVFVGKASPWENRPTQATVIDDIIRFAQQYPKARVLITSRIIGYNPDRLQHAGFRHFTIQPLDSDEIHEFIDRWYSLALSNDPDKPRLVQRLKDAIAHSKAIQNLADNPLLLTMMAILNRRQELPRDRADLYDQASRVLLYHWDVDHKRLQVREEAIGRREKQEMLRAIAYEMQTSDEGLKGNLISADRLTRVLTNYLRDQGFSEPREKANRLIAQLRERNFILCYRGADTYSFVHRTFLEYFCAVEIVHRFEKQRTLTFDQLRDQIFGQHWQDETWHEVLRLICGMIDAKFAGELIEFLMEQECDRTAFLSEIPWEKGRLEPGGLSNLLIAADCASEVNNSAAISAVFNKLLQNLQQEANSTSTRLSFTSSRELLDKIARCSSETLPWLKQQVEQNSSSFIQNAAVLAIAKYFDRSITLTWLKKWAQFGLDWGVRVGAVEAIDKYHFCTTQDIFYFLKSLQHDVDWGVRQAVVEAIAKHYNDIPETLEFLCTVVQNDPFIRNSEWQDNPRQASLDALLKYYPTYPKTLELLRDRAANDPDQQLREWAQEQLKMQNEKLKVEDGIQ